LLMTAFEIQAAIDPFLTKAPPMIPNKRARFKEWLESGEARLLPLTLPQRELWENSPVALSDPANHICGFIDIKGPLTFDQSLAALSRVIARHEALRTSFLPGKERPLQMVRIIGTPNLLFRDLTTEGRSPEELEAIMRLTFLTPLDLMQGPLHLVEMIRLSERHHLLVFSIHHAIADGWSLGVFVQDLCTAYLLGLRGLPASPHGGLSAVPQTYAEWSAADRAFWQPAELAKRLPFWQTHLAGSRPVFPVPPDAPPESGPLERWVSSIPPGLTREVRAFSKQAGTTLFSSLLSLFQFALAKWTGNQDILTGSPVANRTRELCWQTMGYYAGVVPIRGRVELPHTFSERARAMHDTAVDCFAQAIPFAELAAALAPAPTPSKTAHTIFDVRFALQNHPVPDVNLPGITSQLKMRSTGTARFELGCEITEDGEALEVVWLFRPRILTDFGPEGLHQRFLDVISYACRHPDFPGHTFNPATP
jgi:hypothetical protein